MLRQIGIKLRYEIAIFYRGEFTKNRLKFIPICDIKMTNFRSGSEI